MVYVGVDWAEAHHDICVVDEEGHVLAKRRVPDGLEGVGKLHALVAEHAEDPAMVVAWYRNRPWVISGLVGCRRLPGLCHQSVRLEPLSRPPCDLGSEV